MKLKIFYASTKYVTTGLFSKIFGFFLQNDFDQENAKDLILYNYSLSALVLHERIHNRFYKKIKLEAKISEDLQSLKDEIFNDYLKKKRKLN
jgi:hypothetical protein